MIGYLLLALGAAATAVVLYYVAPAARGAHRLVVPRATLRAEATRKDAQAEELACKLIGLASEFDAVTGQRDELQALLDKAWLRIADLAEQVRDRDQLDAANTAFKAELANVRAMRSLLPRPAADDTSALPDELQEFADQTSTAWRTRA